MGTPATIPGLPPGAILKPMAPPPQAAQPLGIEGLPAGAVLKPMTGSTGQPAPGTGTPANPLTENSKAEGTYQMHGPQGVLGVPYSKVQDARDAGYDFVSGSERDRHFRDYASDPQTQQSIDDLAKSSPEGHLMQLGIGAVKDQVQVPMTIAKWLDGLRNRIDSARGYQQKPGDATELEDQGKKMFGAATNPQNGGYEIAGGIGDQILQWAIGEGEAKQAFNALSESQKIKRLGQVTDFLEKHPGIALAAKHGLVAVGQGGQQLLHGATPTTAAEAGATAGVAGAAVEGVTAGAGKLIEHVRPTTESIAGEEVPILRSQQYGETPTGEEKAPSAVQQMAATRENSASVRRQQIAAAKRIIPAQAQATARTILETMNQTRGLTADADVSKLVQQTHSFGDAADAVHSAAKDAYEEMDKVTDGEFGRVRDSVKKAQADVWRTTGDAHYKALKEESLAKDRLNELFEEHDNDIRPEDKKAADTAYRATFALREVDNAYKPVFDVTRQMSEDGTYRGFDGNAANKRFKTLIERNPNIEKTLGKETVENLQKINNLNRTTANREKFGATVSAAAKYLNGHWFNSGMAIEAGYSLLHAQPKQAAAAGTYFATRAVLHAAATNPRIADSLIHGLEYGAKTDRLAPIIGAMVAQNAKDNGSEPEDHQP